MDAANAWSQPEQQFDAIAGIGETDFNLVDIDFNDFDFLNFDPNSEQNGEKLPTNIDLNLLSDAAAQHNAAQQAQQQQQRNGNALVQNGGNNNMFGLNMHQMTFGQQHEQTYAMNQTSHAMSHHSIIPSTPNSVEMHGDAGRYLQQMDAQSRAMIEQHFQQQQKRDAVSCEMLVQYFDY
jgi:hypothetical protein